MVRFLKNRQVGNIMSGVLLGTGPDMTEVAQCQVHTCLRFKVNNLKPYITLRQLLARYPNFEFL